MNLITNKKSGFTLLETLLYAAGLILILAGIVTFIFYMYEWYRKATVPSRVDMIGVTLLSKIGNDIRSSNVVNDADSSFSVSNGAISVTSTNNSVSTTTKYYIQSGAIKYKLNTGSADNISPNDVYVSGFSINKLTTSVSTAIRIQLNLDYATKAGTTTNTYTNLITLRQSYN